MKSVRLENRATKRPANKPGRALVPANRMQGRRSLIAFEKLLAHARATRKPPLTIATLNALLSKQETGRRDALLAEAYDDPKAFIRRHFAVTAVQRKAMLAWTPGDITEIQKVIDAARHRKALQASERDPELPNTAASASGGDRVAMWTPCGKLVLLTVSIGT